MLQVGVVGISNKTAPLEVRETLARAIMKKSYLDQELHLSFVLVMTCNRFELYFSSYDLLATYHRVMEVIKGFLEEAKPSYFYHFFGSQCFYHLSKVIAGLDAAILGESDVQRQVKKAYTLAAKMRPLDKTLHYIFQKGLRIGKILRTNFFPLASSKTLEELVALQLQGVQKQAILFIGYSDINRKIAKFLSHKGFGPMTFCSRSPSFLSFERRHEWINYPIVIVATEHAGYLIHEQDIKNKHVQTTHIFDLGMPRHVDPSLSKNGSFCLMGLDEIVSMIDHSAFTLDVLPCEKKIKELTCQYETIYMERELNKCQFFESVSV